MSKIRILLAEDNPIHATKMEMLLSEMEYDLIGVFSNSDDVLRSFRATKPDLLLLDIDLENRTDGIEIAAQINEIRPTPIIFVTASNDSETVLQANKTEPYAFLVKPIEKGTLQASIELAIYKFAKDEEKQDLAEPFVKWNNDLLIKDSFFVKAGSRLEKVAGNSILWLELSDKRYCDIITEGRTYHIRTPITTLVNKFDSTNFVRIHRKYVVNISKVDSIDESEPSVTIGHKVLPIGKTFKSVFFARLNTIR